MKTTRNGSKIERDDLEPPQRLSDSRKRDDSEPTSCTAPKRRNDAAGTDDPTTIATAWRAAARHARALLSDDVQARISEENQWRGGNGPDDVAANSPTYVLSALLVNGRCQWPDCTVYCPTAYDYFNHINADHCIGAKSIAQFKIQTHLVQQLELKLEREIRCLGAMHAYLASSLDKIQSGEEDAAEKPETESQRRFDAVGMSPSPPLRPMSQFHRTGAADDSVELIRQAIEPYRNVDSRPPLTYIVLIRQAILESNSKQLALSDIYQWFSANFVFFKPNVPAWKNAVRHNLSLHKCFVRVENFKGAVWTVNEHEYQRRKSHRSPSIKDDIIGRGALPPPPPPPPTTATATAAARRRPSPPVLLEGADIAAAGAPFYAQASPYVAASKGMLFPPSTTSATPFTVPFQSANIRYITSEEATRETEYERHEGEEEQGKTDRND
ncbi:forkhead box protein P4-like isoform X2 [Oscarella lobularis]|uniref:forkhead box protein P4-like isoform X2 n=1 Tax=Oscarella lobularis TaxID=121494 RepID=UPI0033143FEF